ncbi:hypothetical protein F5Y09DRAFT_312231 [Xylaria sp. FL1042]|nr:hypothetical protein F5Y09DRAFT_312231 [Xylaria sp. FL1042]
MALLQDLPNGTPILLLRFLSAINLQATILAQRVSRRFHNVTQDAILYSATASYTWLNSLDHVQDRGAKINPLLGRKFKGLFDSADCRGPRLHPGAYFYDPRPHGAGLRPAFGVSLRTRRLDVTKSFEDPVAYFQIEPPGSGLTMELLYDMISCSAARKTLYRPHLIRAVGSCLLGRA